MMDLFWIVALILLAVAIRDAGYRIMMGLQSIAKAIDSELEEPKK